MTNRSHTPIAAALLASLVAAPVVSAQGAERFSLPGNAAIYNLAGDVVIEPGTAAGTVVELSRGGADAARLTIDVGEIEGWNTLRVRYPDDRIVYPRLPGRSQVSLGVDDNGLFGQSWSGRTPDASATGGVLRMIGLGAGRRVTIRGSGSGLEAYADLRILVPPGRTVAVHVGAGTARASNVEGSLFIETHNGGIQASRHRGELRLDTGSGDIQATSGRGNLYIDTGSGSVAADDYSGDVLSIDTGSGSIRAASLEFGRAGVDTGSGNVEITSVTARDGLDVDTGAGSITLARVAADAIVLDTGSGRVSVELLSRAPSLAIDTGSGSVTLSVPSDLSAALDLETGSGGIDVDLPIRVERRERDELRATVGDGRGSIRVETGSGGIRIRSASIR